MSTIIDEERVPDPQKVRRRTFHDSVEKGKKKQILFSSFLRGSRFSRLALYTGILENGTLRASPDSSEQSKRYEIYRSSIVSLNYKGNGFTPTSYTEISLS